MVASPDIEDGAAGTTFTTKVAALEVWDVQVPVRIHLYSKPFWPLVVLDKLNVLDVAPE